MTTNHNGLLGEAVCCTAVEVCLWTKLHVVSACARKAQSCTVMLTNAYACNLILLLIFRHFTLFSECHRVKPSKISGWIRCTIVAANAVLYLHLISSPLRIGPCADRTSRTPVCPSSSPPDRVHVISFISKYLCRYLLARAPRFD